MTSLAAMYTTLACPECDRAVTASSNRRQWCDGGRRAAPDERWICRECGATFAEPVERPSKRFTHPGP